MFFDPNQAPLITETLLKKRRTLEDLAASRAQTVAKVNKKRKIVRGEAIRIRRPEQFVKDYLIMDKSQKNFERKKSQGELNSMKLINATNQLSTTIGFIVRVHGAQHASKSIKRELNMIGLRKKYSAVFCRIDAKSLEKLQSLDNYIAYGFISLKMVESLLHKRCHVLDEGMKKPIQDNLLVEKLWGKQDILCLNDLSYELYNVTEKYDSIVNQLLPFTLTAPVGKFSKESLHIHEDKKGFLANEMEVFVNNLI